MGSLSQILPIIGDIAATATGNPELIPLIHGGTSLASGQGLGNSLKSAGLAFAGQQFLPVLGNTLGSNFPETAASLGINGGANTLTDLFGQTGGGNSSLFGPGTIGGDLTGNFSSGSGLGNLLGGSTKPIQGPLQPGAGSLGNTASSGFGGSGGTGGQSSSFGGGNLYGNIAALGGGLNSLDATDQAKKDLLNAQNQASGVLQPYLASGTAANNKLSDFLGTSGNPTSTTDILASNPAYQFQLDQGTQALNRKQAATGNYFSGGALKDAQNFGQGLANQTASDYYSRLAQQSGQGQTAAGTLGNIFEQTGTAKANAGIAGSNILNQTLSSLLTGSGAYGRRNPYAYGY